MRALAGFLLDTLYERIAFAFAGGAPADAGPGAQHVLPLCTDSLAGALHAAESCMCVASWGVRPTALLPAPSCAPMAPSTHTLHVACARLSLCPCHACNHLP